MIVAVVPGIKFRNRYRVSPPMSCGDDPRCRLLNFSLPEPMAPMSSARWSWFLIVDKDTGLLMLWKRLEKLLLPPVFS